MKFRLVPYKDRVVIEVHEPTMGRYGPGTRWRPVTITEAMNLTLVVKEIGDDIPAKPVNTGPR